MRKNILLLFSFLCLLQTSMAQVPYSYAPNATTDETMTGVGSNKNSFVQGAVLFDPATDPVVARLKGKSVKGMRCYLRADYAQARQKRSAVQVFQGSLSNNILTQYVDFVQGWNDITFDEPLVIGDEKLYFGLQVYETIGTPYPLVTYSKATVAQSCWINLGKKTWEEYTDRGTLYVALLLDEADAASFASAAYAQNVSHPQTVAPDTDFEGELYIHNFAAEPLHSVEIAMQGEGAATPTLRTIEFSTAIPAYGSTVVKTNLHAGVTQGTNVDWTVTVTKFNGVTAQNARPGTTKLYVTRDNFIRTPIVEEFTSQRCTNCPQMAYYLEKAFEEYEGKYVYLAHHVGFVNDVFTAAADEEIRYIFGGYENEYNPAIMYNRAMLDGESTVIQGIRDMSPTPYLEGLAAAANMPAMAELNILPTDENIRVEGRVANDLVSQQIYLSCYLVEDGISTDKYPQLGMTDPDAPEDLKDVFRHNGVILHHFTKSAAGDLIEADEEGRFSMTFPTVEKEGFGGTRRRYVALAHRTNKENLRDNQVLNATEFVLGETGIKGIPATDSGKTDTLYDLQGRIVSNTQHGVYIKNGKKILK